jgi:hypothetical protein
MDLLQSYQEMSSILADQYRHHHHMSPNAVGGGGVEGTVHRRPNKLWRSNSMRLHIDLHIAVLLHDSLANKLYTEPVFVNVYGAQESIPRNEFRQHM